MSGRAGRRGLDDRGIVIMMCDEKLEPSAAKNMVKGEADRLDSAFHLGYNMILNLMRVEGVSPEYMLQRCFYQFQNTASVPALEAGAPFVTPLDSPDLFLTDSRNRIAGLGRPQGGDRHFRRGHSQGLLRHAAATDQSQQRPSRRHQPPYLCTPVPAAWASRSRQT
jgi:hypothetical protein